MWARTLAGAAVMLAVASQAGAAAATTPSLEGGALGTNADINLGQYGTFVFNGPAVVTPPDGGVRTATLGPITFGGYPPYNAPTISIGPSAVRTFGDAATPRVASSADVEGLSLLAGLGGIDLHSLSSQCAADDGPRGPGVSALAVADGRVGDQDFHGRLEPNTRIPLTIGSGATQLELTVVLDEQVPGQTTDHFPGILVNAVHVYVGSPGGTYSSDGAIFGQSRCEVAPAPLPPGVVSEAPLAALLPLSALGIGGAVLVRARRRRRTD